ncbi:MAG: hypothetical protein H6R10_1290 [Rhodocyclaceae bacterium]|nr:hypothetical protein [Rhodocyclaceae bacterium]
MSVRIKRHWFKEDSERSAADAAGATAVAVWKAAAHGLQSVRKAKFDVQVGTPYLGVLTEFLLFLITAADRIVYRHDQAEWRQAFMAALAKRLSEIYQENLDHLVGPVENGGHRRRFIDLLNARMAEYAEFDYGDDGPDFGFRRYFGSRIEAVLTDPDDRRWVLDAIMSIQAPEAVEVVERGLRGLLGIDPKPRRRAAGGE